MNKFERKLRGGDLRSIGKADNVVKEVRSRRAFDILIKGLNNPDRIVAMRTADAIEKITVTKPDFLQKYKAALLQLCRQENHSGLNWHLALLLPRLKLTAVETDNVWQFLITRAADKQESKLVRVNSLQGLYELVLTNNQYKKSFEKLVHHLKKENIPSLNARLKKLTAAGGRRL